jgi:hypothetical protein
MNLTLRDLAIHSTDSLCNIWILKEETKSNIGHDFSVVASHTIKAPLKVQEHLKSKRGFEFLHPNQWFKKVQLNLPELQGLQIPREFTIFYTASNALKFMATLLDNRDYYNRNLLFYSFGTYPDLVRDLITGDICDFTERVNSVAITSELLDLKNSIFNEIKSTKLKKSLKQPILDRFTWFDELIKNRHIEHIQNEETGNAQHACNKGDAEHEPVKGYISLHWLFFEVKKWKEYDLSKPAGRKKHFEHLNRLPQPVVETLESKNEISKLPVTEFKFSSNLVLDFTESNNFFEFNNPFMSLIRDTINNPDHNKLTPKKLDYTLTPLHLEQFNEAYRELAFNLRISEYKRVLTKSSENLQAFFKIHSFADYQVNDEFVTQVIQMLEIKVSFGMTGMELLIKLSDEQLHKFVKLLNIRVERTIFWDLVRYSRYEFDPSILRLAPETYRREFLKKGYLFAIP